MPRIVNNRICYRDHNVVHNEACHKQLPGYILEMADFLAEHGTAQIHELQLQTSTFSNWSIERPTVVFCPIHSGKCADWLLPDRIQAEVMLHNGNYMRHLFAATIATTDPFKLLWDNMYQNGIKIGSLQRRRVEADFHVEMDKVHAKFTQARKEIQQEAHIKG